MTVVKKDANCVVLPAASAVNGCERHKVCVVAKPVSSEKVLQTISGQMTQIV